MRMPKKIIALLMACLLVLSPAVGIPLSTEGYAASEIVLKTSVSPEAFSEGETVTVTVSLNTTVNTQGFGLDYSTAYDHTAFEWVGGDWSEQIKSASVLAPVNPGTQAAFGAMSEIDVSGEVFSFVLRPIGSFSCGDSYDVEVLPSKALDAVTVGTSVSFAHTYDNACDGDCNVCGDKRYVKHVFDGLSDESCSACGHVRALPTYVHAVHRGDEVTVTVSLTNTEAVTVRGFGLDFRGSYDTSAFEWVSGSWSQTILDNATLQSVNAGKEAVFAAISEFSLSGEVFTMVLKVKDDADFGDYDVVLDIRKGGDSVLSTTTVTVHECTASASLGSDGEGHWSLCETYACPAELNRTPHDYSVRDKDEESHWMKCSVCSAVDESSRTAHGYDNACDTICNTCDNVRTVPHDYSVRDKDEESHWMKCSVCSAVDESSRTAHGYDNACDTICDACEHTRTVPHDYSVRDKDEESHWMKCSVCSAVDESSRTAHGYDNACDTICNTCDNVRTVPHDYSVQEKDGESHWMKCSVCSAVDESSRTAHGYDDHNDLICDGCGYERPPYLLGDTNGNGVMDSDDAIHLLFAINFPETYLLNQPCDFDSSGKVDSDDAIYLLFHINFKENYPLFPNK